MKHVPINVLQDAQEHPGALTVAQALAAASHLKHAGDVQMQHLLTNSDSGPSFLTERLRKREFNALIFGGTIKLDENDNEYVIAVYFKKHKGLVAEKYWLSSPMLQDLYFAIED